MPSIDISIFQNPYTEETRIGDIPVGSFISVPRYYDDTRLKGMLIGMPHDYYLAIPTACRLTGWPDGHLLEMAKRQFEESYPGCDFLKTFGANVTFWAINSCTNGKVYCLPICCRPYLDEEDKSYER